MDEKEAIMKSIKCDVSVIGAGGLSVAAGAAPFGIKSMEPEPSTETGIADF